MTIEDKIRKLYTDPQIAQVARIIRTGSGPPCA